MILMPTHHGEMQGAQEDGWWNDNGNIPLSNLVGAWQAVGASSYADSLVDRSGNGNDINFATAPGWNAADGWTTSQESDFFDDAAPIGSPFSIIWFGTTADSTTDVGMIGSGAGWVGMSLHSWSSGQFFCGCNSSYTGRFDYYSVPGGVERSHIYTKNASNQQNMFMDGSRILPEDKAGTNHTVTTIKIVTGNGGSCKAVAIYNIELTAANASSIHSQLAAL